MAFGLLGRPLGGRGRRLSPPRSIIPRGIRRSPRRSLPYAIIREQVLAAIAQLPPQQQAQIPAAGTLPELMVGLALLRLGYHFEAQVSEDGGRLRLGGAVVDYKVWLGMQVVIIRVQGDYWHSLPDRKRMDVVQYERLKRMGFLVADIWESALYEAWMDGHLEQLVDEALMGAL